jgi:dipeptidase D
VSGSILLNLDSEEDGRLTVGSASSTDTSIRVEKPRGRCLPGAVTLSVVLSGGFGGHSGTDIARGRANAIKALVRALRETLAAVPFQLVALDGGRSWNAIPREAVAVCSVAAEREADFRAAVEAADKAIREAHSRTDPNVAVSRAGGGRGRRVDGGCHRGPARSRRHPAQRAARDEPGLRGSRRNEHFAR